eukprot:4083009-Amphidinium_carterae.5
MACTAVNQCIGCARWDDGLRWVRWGGLSAFDLHIGSPPPSQANGLRALVHSVGHGEFSIVRLAGHWPSTYTGADPAVVQVLASLETLYVPDLPDE